MSPVVLTSALLFLALLDLFLALWVFGSPDHFYCFFFGRQTEGSRQLLYRSGGLWLTFSLIQFIALFTWETYPVVLLLVVGVRLSEWCADWIFLLTETTFTWIGRVGFFVSPLFTVFFAFVFFLGYQSFGLKPVQAIQIISYQPSPLLMDALLTALLLIDLLLAREALLTPQRGFGWLLSGAGSDSAGLLSRTGGIWLGFAVVQLAVLLTWRSWPAGLLIVAGMRLTETLADWIVLAVREREWVYDLILVLVPPLNFAAAVVLYQGFMVSSG